MGIDPATLAIVSIGLSAVSGVAGMAAQQQQTAATQQAEMTNAAIAERNKILVDQDRQLALRTAEIAAEDKDRENRRNLAAMRAAYGASGLELTGSALDVLSDTTIEMALDSRRIEYEGRVRNREGAIQMLGLEEEANRSRQTAKDAGKAGRISTFGSLAKTVASGAGSYYNYKAGASL